MGLLSDSSLTQLVNDALRNYQSTLALSRSPLASSALVTPTLVRDEASPTAEECGHGLRLVLQWAVNRLAPAAPRYSLGEPRPFDDPTWRDPCWWRYTILRHRYLEPLHPDEFIDGGRYTETLLALTGISSSDAFFDERNRAIRDVAALLRQQLLDGAANDELQRLALQEIVQALERQPAVAALLGVAATLDDILPRSLLMELAAYERMLGVAATLDALIAQRLLLTGDEGTSLWLAPVLRTTIYARQLVPDRQRRHRWVAAYYEARGAALLAARHWQRAEEDARALRVLLPAVPELIHELQLRSLIDLLQQLAERRLQGDQWFTAQLLLSDLFQQSGQHDEALRACRRALRASAANGNQARVYRRMGKLYEGHNPLHALRYYQQAVERFDPSHPELAELFKDRGWLYFYRQEWDKAERDLLQALALAPQAATSAQAAILDALANLYRKRCDFERALAYAERALAIREEIGELLGIAKSLGNLGFLYQEMGELSHALQAHTEARNTYQQMDNPALTATAWLNMGMVQHVDGRIEDAIESYHQSLAITERVGLPLIELKAHYNLAEALAALARHTDAALHWQTGYRLCRQHGFDDQEADFLALRTTIAATLEVEPPRVNDAQAAPSNWAVHLGEEDAFVLTLAHREQGVTPKRLMHAAHISRATATRWLTGLVEKGHLTVEGKGRATVYMPAVTAPTSRPQLAQADHVQRQLSPHCAEFRQRFQMTALGVVARPNGCSPRIKLAARFVTTPDLALFLTLQAVLADRLQAEVELWPLGVVDGLVAEGEEALDRIVWIW